MKYIIIVCLSFLSVSLQAQKNKEVKNFYELKVYEYHSAEQKQMIDEFISEALIPFFHKKGIGKIGAFTLTTNDTASVKKLYVLIPYKSLNQIPTLNKTMFSEDKVAGKASAYLNATNEAPAYDKLMSIVMEGFRFAPTLTPPNLKGSIEDKIYELRSYQSVSEKKYWKKVEMFNEGGEVPLFARLGFNAVFYAEVISGPTMPNLMYMTSFESMKDRDAHWNTFKDDAEWKRLSGLKEYEKIVSKNVTLFLKATKYSEY